MTQALLRLSGLAAVDFRFLVVLGISHEGFTLTTWNESGCGAEEGHPQGLPLRWIVGGYFQRNDRGWGLE